MLIVGLAFGLAIVQVHSRPIFSNSPIPLPGPKYYHELKITRELSTTHHTHVAVQGFVLDVISEEDGDLHIRLSDGTVSKCDVPAYMAGKCVVAEIRPQDQDRLPRPHKGEMIKVYGISRYDRAHKWWEVHPVDKLDVQACADNSEPPCR